MDLIKKVETTEFSQRLRGYDIDEVDAFHAELVNEIAQMKRQLAEMSEGDDEPARAPSSARSVDRPEFDGRLHDPDGAIERMLAVAQRTADEVLSEARDDAERQVADAEAHAFRVTSEADARATNVTTEAEEQRRLIVAEAAAEARRLAEATRSELIAEITELEGARDALLIDLEVLETHVDAERTHMTAAVERLQEVLEDPAAFRRADPPELQASLEPIAAGSTSFDAEPESDSDAEPEWASLADEDGDGWEADDDDWDDDEAVVDIIADESESESESESDSDRESESDTDSTSATVFDAGAEDEFETVGGGQSAPAADAWDDDVWDDDDEDDAAIDSLGSSLFDDGPGASVTDLASARNEVLRPADEPLPSPKPVRSPYPDEVDDDSTRLPWDDEPAPKGGPPTEAVLIDDLLGADNADNDRFLDELRRATEDEFGADESDAAIAAFFDQDEDDESSKRRGRRS